MCRSIKQAGAINLQRHEVTAAGSNKLSPNIGTGSGAALENFAVVRSSAIRLVYLSAIVDLAT
jgi:hypothetical protein